MDRRWRDLGEILVRYSTDVQPGERVMIAMGEVETYPLTRAVYQAAVRAGAYVQVQFHSEALRHALLRYGTLEHAGWVPEIESYGMEWADVYIGLRGAYNLYETADVPAETLAANQRAQGKISSLRWEKTRWCLVRVPNEYFAQQAETDLDTILEMFFDACTIDWAAESRRWEETAKALDQGKLIRIAGKDTDLSFSVEGRKWVVGNGKLNMPDGEIMTAPRNDAALSGHISFELPAVLGGRLVHGLRLRWQNGRLGDASADSNEAFLREMLASDDGARCIGEFAFGVNPQVNRFCKDILIDEKIGGTVHIALGRAYPGCGGDNKSVIHWDIVKDLRRDGTVFLDGKPVFQGGKLLV